MIQIQDDFQADSASTQSAPSAPAAPAPTINDYNPAPATPAASVAPVASATPAADKNQDIDELLRQIEELSKQLESEKQQDTAPAPVASAASEAVVAPTMTDQPVAPAQPAAAVPAAAPGAGNAEEFDLDSFLKDLEQRIQEDEAKNPPAAPAAASEPAVAPMAPAPAADEAAAEEATFRKNRSASDAYDEGDLADSAASQSPVAAAAPAAESTPAVDEESLQMQNIFDMLGLDQISDEEKNQFLDELEQLIWNDFVEKDLPLLLTSAEHEEAKKIIADPQKQGDAGKEALLNYLSSLIPDLEDILYQKALELKAEMFSERVKRMNTDVDEAMSAKLKEVESLVAQNRYKSAVKLLAGS